MSKDTLICIGAIMGGFGVRGEVRVKSFCAIAQDLDTYGPLFSEDGARSFDLRITRPVKAGFAARIKGVVSKNDADALRGTRLCVPRAALPGLVDDEYYYTDLIGLDVFDTGGQKLGRVKAVHDHGAGDVIELSGPSFGADTHFAFTQAQFPTVDIASGKLIFDPMPVADT